MRRILLASAAATALSLGFGYSALAADLPVYTKAPAAPYYGWTGFYVGVDVGYGWKDPTVTATGNDPLSAIVLNGKQSNPGDQPVGPANFTDKGAFGGVEAGYNWQIGRSWLVGVETDFNASNIHGQGSNLTVLDTTVPITQQLSATQNVEWFGTVRARAGWLATDSLLLYGTGGLAYGKVDETVNFGYNVAASTSGLGESYSCPAGFGQCVYGASSRIATGWTAGAGTEYRVPGTNASLKLEYLYVNLGAGNTFNATAVNPGAGSNPIPSISARYSSTEFNTVKLGLNWHF